MFSSSAVLEKSSSRNSSAAALSPSKPSYSRPPGFSRIGRFGPRSPRNPASPPGRLVFRRGGASGRSFFLPAPPAGVNGSPGAGRSNRGVNGRDDGPLGPPPPIGGRPIGGRPSPLGRKSPMGRASRARASLIERFRPLNGWLLNRRIASCPCESSGNSTNAKPRGFPFSLLIGRYTDEREPAADRCCRNSASVVSYGRFPTNRRTGTDTSLFVDALGHCGLRRRFELCPAGKPNRSY